jgi:hypothetical protein
MASKKSNGLSFDAMIGQNVVTTDSKKKKEQLPIINLDDTLSAELKKFINKKAEMKAAEGEMRLAEQPVLQVCLDRMDSDALSNDFHSSYEVKSTDGTKVKFVTTDKFNISNDPENIQALRDALGDDFDDEIVAKPTVVLKAEVFEDASLQKELTGLLGDKFSKFFETIVKYSTKEGFDERMYKIAGDKGKAIQLRSLAGKNKPFLK